MIVLKYIINLIVTSLGNRLHVENLSRVILNSRQHNNCNVVTLLVNRIQYIFGSQQIFSLPPCNQDCTNITPQQVVHIVPLSRYLTLKISWPLNLRYGSLKIVWNGKIDRIQVSLGAIRWSKLAIFHIPPAYRTYQSIMLIVLFLVSHFNFLFVPCGGLSWLLVSFLLHDKYTLSYRIVSYRMNYINLDKISDANAVFYFLCITIWYCVFSTKRQSIKNANYMGSPGRGTVLKHFSFTTTCTFCTSKMLF